MLDYRIRIVEVQDKLFPVDQDRMPVFICIPGKPNDLLLPIFSTLEDLIATMGDLGLEFSRVLKIVDSDTFMARMPDTEKAYSLDNPDLPPISVRVIADLKIINGGINYSELVKPIDGTV